MTRTIRTLRAAALLPAAFGLALAVACGEEDVGIEDRAGYEQAMEDDELAEGDETPMEDDPDVEQDVDVAAGAAGREPAGAGLAAGEGFEDHRDEVRVVAAEIEAVPVLIPSTIVVTQDTRSFRVRNEGRTERTLRIEGLPSQAETRLPAGEETTVNLGETQPGAIYAIVLSDTSAATGPGMEAGAQPDVAAPGSETGTTPGMEGEQGMEGEGEPFAGADAETGAQPGMQGDTAGAQPGMQAETTAEPGAGEPGAAQTDPARAGERQQATLIILPARSSGATTGGGQEEREGESLSQTR